MPLAQERSLLIQRLREELSEHPATALLLKGLPGVGLTTILGGITRSTPHIYHRANPLPDPQERTRLWHSVLAYFGDDSPTSDPPRWKGIIDWLVEKVRFSRQPFVLALDEAHHLDRAGGRFTTELLDRWHRARAQGSPLRLVLASSDPGLESALRSAATEVQDLRIEKVEPLSFRGVAQLFPDWSDDDRLRAWGLFGGRPKILCKLNPHHKLSTHFRRLVLDPDGSLHTRPLEELAAPFRNVTRYLGVLAAIARGDQDWGSIRKATASLTGGAQLGPYLKTLEEEGLVQVARSLDADPKSRRRRYLIADPFLHSWLLFVLPNRTQLVEAEIDDFYRNSIKPVLRAYLELQFQRICLDYLKLHITELLGSDARESGALWGSGYDIPVAGTLRNGAACYGMTFWSRIPDGAGEAAALEEALKSTKYGFTKETRHRIFFTRSGVGRELARLDARAEDVHILTIERLLGLSHGD